MTACPSCAAEVLDIDVKCGACGASLNSTGAQRMIGQVMLGVYELVDVLGSGGMRVVYKGKHKMTDQEVALKILPPELAAHAQVKSRFLEEAKALAQLDHPNIVHLYNFGQENGSFVLAMQFVEGKTWERLILENDRLDWPTSARVACDVLRALEYAHGRGIIHRDMKPSNVLVRDLDGSATVMDFGIAKMTTSTKLTATGQTMGTVRYMSPEQVRGQEVDLRTDIYSLGATLYESLTGDTPFDGQTHFEIMTKHLSEPPKRPSSLGIAIPEAMEDALMRSLSKRADDRFAAAREMRKILENALRDGDVGLLETQKVSRDLLSDVRKPTTTRPPPAGPPGAGATVPSRPSRVATAADLASNLEGDTGPRRRQAKVKAKAKASSNLGVWVAITGVIAAAGAGTAFFVSRHRHAATVDAGPAEVQPPEIPGVTLVASRPFPAVHLTLAATAGGVSPGELADAYSRTLERFRVFAKAKAPGLAIDFPVEMIVAVPQNVMCAPSLYLNNQTPPKCSAIPAAIADALPKTLLVVNVPAKLDAAMQHGVADAVCTFQTVEGDEATKSKRINEICELTATFDGKGHP
jgi:serine/threonine protein kinase